MSGYILVDPDGLIHGCGSTAEAAWRDAETLRDPTLSEEEYFGWRNELRSIPATAALLSYVERAGGNVAWTRNDSEIADVVWWDEDREEPDDAA